ncbi:hypothetical protein Tco_0715291 [Tanacetum coccineum]
MMCHPWSVYRPSPIHIVLTALTLGNFSDKISMYDLSLFLNQAIEQTATGKGTSNPLMAGSLPKTTKPTSLSSFITIAKGGSSLIFTLFSLPAGAELTFEAEELLLPLAGAEDGSFILTPFKVSAFNMDFDLKIDLTLFDPKIGSTPSNFFSGGRGVLQTEYSSAESYSVAEESVTVIEGPVVFLCESAGSVLLVS